MANEKKAPVTGEKKASAPAKDAPVASMCKFEGCRKSPDKFSFCAEHYELYMGGVIRGDGKKPIDYEQKLRLHLQKNSQRKAA
jgi:hypothetical protein